MEVKNEETVTLQFEGHGRGGTLAMAHIYNKWQSILKINQEVYH